MRCTRSPRGTRLNGACFRWLAVVLAVAGSAGAQSTAFQVPAACGSEAEFRERLAALAGVDATRAMPSSLVITADGGGGFRLTLGVGGETRELVHPDCRVLFRSALVIAATAANPELELDDAALELPPAAPAPPYTSQTTPAAPVPAEAPQHAAKPERTSNRVLRGSVAAGAGIGLGVAPNAAPVFELRAAAHFNRWAATLSGHYFPPSVATSEGRRVEIQGAGARLAGRVAPHRLVALSLGLEADWLHGEGGGDISSPTKDSAWAVAPLAEVALVPWQNRHFSFEIAALGRVALLRPVFEVTGYGTVYEVPRLGFVGSARGAWHFP